MFSFSLPNVKHTLYYIKYVQSGITFIKEMLKFHMMQKDYTCAIPSKKSHPSFRKMETSQSI